MLIEIPSREIARDVAFVAFVRLDTRTKVPASVSATTGVLPNGPVVRAGTPATTDRVTASNAAIGTDLAERAFGVMTVSSRPFVPVGATHKSWEGRAHYLLAGVNRAARRSIPRMDATPEAEPGAPHR